MRRGWRCPRGSAESRLGLGVARCLSEERGERSLSASARPLVPVGVPCGERPARRAGTSYGREAVGGITADRFRRYVSSELSLGPGGSQAGETQKSERPLHRNVLGGGFCVKLFWRCKFGMYASVLGVQKVSPFIKNMDKDSLAHVSSFLAASAVADLVFIMTVVKEPPPELFLRDPDLYRSMVQNASGITLLEGLSMVQLPAIQWKR